MLNLIIAVLPLGWFPQDWRDHFVFQHEGREIVEMHRFFNPDKIIPGGSGRWLWCYDRRPITDMPLVIVMTDGNVARFAEQAFALPGGMPTLTDIAACAQAIMPEPPPPPPPVLGSAQLTWTAPSRNIDGTPLTGITGYQVEWGRGNFASSATVSGLSYAVTGLVTGEWQFRVRALAGDVVGQPTASVFKEVP